jgi:sulfate transport system permease protein
MTQTSAVVANGPLRPPAKRPFLRRRTAVPGFGVTMGVTLTVLSLIVLIPLSAVAIKAMGVSFPEFLSKAFSERAIKAYELSFTASLIAAAINGIFGVMTAWAMVRYSFPGKRILNALVDLPFALPTAVAGIALASLYSPPNANAAGGVMGQLLAHFHIKAAYNATGVVIALTFIGLPFVVRTLEPIMHDLAEDVEEAAASLGAHRLSIIGRVILPALAPAWLTGFAMAFARGLGEYGSIVFIAGNMPYKSEIAPLLIIIQLEQYDYHAAAGIALVLLIFSFVMLMVINAIQAWSRRFA